MRIITLSFAIVALMTMGAFTKNKSLVVTSSAFTNNGMIPTKYTCLGQEASPPLKITNIPTGTKSLVLIIEDPDALVKPVESAQAVQASNVTIHHGPKPKHRKKLATKKNAAAPVKVINAAVVTEQPQGCFTHWLIWNLESEGVIPENFKNDFEGMNSIQQVGYKGMCPQKGLHHYHFKVYALDTKLNIPRSSDKAAVEKVIEGHILAWGDLVGTFDKNYR